MSLGTKKQHFGYKNFQPKEALEKALPKPAVKFGYKKRKSCKKAGKGAVTLQVLTNTTRFKYRYRGDVFFLTIPAKGKIHPVMLKEIESIIQEDVLNGNHDNTQEKYKQWLRDNNDKEGWYQRAPNLAVINHIPAPELQPISNVPTPQLIAKAKESALLSLTIYQQLTEWSKATNRTEDKPIYRYGITMVKNWVDKGKDVRVETLPLLLKEMNYAANTFNTRKFVLNLFCSWLVKKKVIDLNPFEDVVAMKKSKAKDPRRKRLTDVEVKEILQAIKDDRFLPANSRGYTHSHYYPIFLFFAYTGVRPSEGIGLQVKKVDFKREVITIDSAFARTMKGSCNSCRVMKSTKTTEERELPFHKNPILKNILRQQCKDRSPNDFVFPSPNGLCCYDRALNDTVFKTVLKGLNIPQRILYCFRHTFCSRCFERGMDIKSVQALTGHRDVKVLLNIYAEVTKSKVTIPNLTL